MDKQVAIDVFNAAILEENRQRREEYPFDVYGLLTHTVLARGKRRVLILGETHGVYESPHVGDILQWHKRNHTVPIDFYVENSAHSRNSSLTLYGGSFMRERHFETVRRRPFDIRPRYISMTTNTSRIIRRGEKRDVMIAEMERIWNEDPDLHRAKAGVSPEMIDRIYREFQLSYTTRERGKEKPDPVFISSGLADVMLNLLFFGEDARETAIVYSGDAHARAFAVFLRCNGFEYIDTRESSTSLSEHTPFLLLDGCHLYGETMGNGRALINVYRHKIWDTVPPTALLAVADLHIDPDADFDTLLELFTPRVGLRMAKYIARGLFNGSGVLTL